MAQPNGQDLKLDPSARPQPQSQGTPWDKDLAFIEDESLRSQVSEYLGKNVQPYITQLEQRAKPALEFYQDFNDEPGATTLGVIEELYGPDAAKTFAEYLTDEFGQEPTEPEAQQPVDPSQDPRLSRMLDSWEQTEQEKEWASALVDLQKTESERAAAEGREAVEIDDMLFRPFAAMTDGDLDQALLGYRAFLDTAREKLVPQAQGPTEDDGFSPPPALGSQGGSSPQPVEKTDQSIGDAISDWVNDLKAQGQTVAPPHPNG